VLLGSPLELIDMDEIRPWGSFTTIHESPGCKVKTIEVEPGNRLSYQSHMFRDERWIIVDGSAGVILEGIRRIMGRGETVFIGRGQRHRLDNPGPVPLMIVEVQLGESLEEDDIVRYEDDYGRVVMASPSGSKVDGERNGKSE
jgi:mannose-6-phosphate isomerase-like protein (cupin superfamily)